MRDSLLTSEDFVDAHHTFWSNCNYEAIRSKHIYINMLCIRHLTLCKLNRYLSSWSEGLERLIPRAKSANSRQKSLIQREIYSHDEISRTLSCSARHPNGCKESRQSLDSLLSFSDHENFSATMNVGSRGRNVRHAGVGGKTPEVQQDRRQDQQIEQGRRKQPAHDDAGHGPFDLASGLTASQGQGQ